MFNEGMDIPDARLLVFLRSTSSQTIFEQQLGRGLRKYEGKDVVSVLDFVANIERLSQIKELIDSITDYQERNPEMDGDTGIGLSEPDSFDDQSGLNIHTGHADFDFDRLTIDILSLYQDIRHGNPYVTMTNEQIADAARQISPDAPLDTPMIAQLAKEGKFVSSTTINARFGSLVEFQQACGFDRRDWNKATKEEIIDAATELANGEKFKKATIQKLSKEKRFAGLGLIAKHFGTIAELNDACGLSEE